MKKMFLFVPMASLILAACGGTSAPAADVSTINGTAQNYTLGAGTVKLLANGGGTESLSNPALSSAPIRAAGVFSLSLPSAASVAPYLSTTAPGTTTQPGCTGSVNESDPAARTYGVSTLSVGNTVLTSTQVTSTASGASASGKLWVYFDRPSTLNGTLSCTDATSGVTTTSRTTFNTAFRQGWNVVTLSGTSTSTPTSSTTTVTATLASDGPSVWTATTLSGMALSTQATAARNAVSQAMNSLR
jgi:hypothetical protein